MKKYSCNCPKENSEQCTQHKTSKYRNPWKQEEEQQVYNEESASE